jgi:hypothetical protein
MAVANASRYRLWLGVSGVVLATMLGLGGVSVFLWRWLHPEQPKPLTPIVAPVRAAERPPVPSVRFTDITEKAGIGFHHVNGLSGHKLLPETMGSGVAFLDYDRDGHQDLLFVNSCSWPGREAKPVPTQALYRNRGDGTFADVTAAAGLSVTFYGMGVTVGDYDNDGWPDVFLTGVGGNRLFQNTPDGQGGRRFEDVTDRAGVAGPGGWPAQAAGDFLHWHDLICFPSSAAFLDYDGDGWLDLFVCNYITWSPQKDLEQDFKIGGQARSFGPPINFKGSQCILYRNDGRGRFEDVSARAGIHVVERGQAVGKSLGVVVCDLDDDGWPDIVVANDTVRNFLFHNKGDGTFEERGERSGVAYPEGVARGAMGIDWGEYRPGRTALVIGNFANEPNTLLRLDRPQTLHFEDVATAEGVAGPSRALLKFGIFFFDYDLDGRLDLLSCNGHLEPEIAQLETGQGYEQPAQLFWNSGGKASFVPATAAEAGPDLFKPLVGRGCAYADIDGDGDLDVVLTANGGPARLLRNDGATGNHWIRLVLEGDGRTSNRSAIGARVTLEAGGVVYHREVTSGRGYLSQSELPLTFGLAKHPKVDRVTIRWPGQAAKGQTLTDLAVDRCHHLRQTSE